MTTREEFDQMHTQRGFWAARPGCKCYRGDTTQFELVDDLIEQGWELNERHKYTKRYDYCLGRCYQHTSTNTGPHDYVKILRRLVSKTTPVIGPVVHTPCGSTEDDFDDVAKLRGLWPTETTHKAYRGVLTGIRPWTELKAEGWNDRAHMIRQKPDREYTLGMKPRDNGIYAQAVWRLLPSKNETNLTPTPAPAPKPACKQQLELPLMSLEHFNISVLFNPNAVKQLLEGSTNMITGLGLLEIKRPKVG